MTADSSRNTPGCCDDSTIQLISNFHDGRYPPGSPESRRVEEHLAQCSSCAEMLDDFRLLSQATRVLCASECPPGDSECYVRCVRDAIRKKSARRRIVAGAWTTGVAAAVAAVVTLAVFVTTDSPVTVADADGPDSVEAVASSTADAVAVVPAAETTASAESHDLFRRFEEAMLLERTAAGRRPGMLPVGTAVIDAPADAAQPRAVLGVYFDELYTGDGVRVTGVAPGSPAHAAGIRPGDVIAQAAEEPLAGAAGAQRLREIVLAAGPGASLALVVVRDGTARRIEAVLAGR